ncbi:hypothetical protein Tco_1037515 [Tanacetum coccineum]
MELQENSSIHERRSRNTRDKTRNLSLKEIAEAKGPVSISFEQGDKQTLNPLGPHAAHWSNYTGEVVRSVPLYYPSWEKVPKERKAVIISEIGAIRQARPEEITMDEWDKQSSDTQEYPSLIDTFWRTHTVDGVFPKDEDRRIYEEMKRLEDTGGASGSGGCGDDEESGDDEEGEDEDGDGDS